MPAWAQVIPGGVALAEWFLTRYKRARALMTAAGVAAADNFDTIIGEDFGQTVTSALVDIVGTADANAENFYNAGVIRVDVDEESQARLQLTGAPSHVGSLSGKSWYAASLFRFTDLPLGDMGEVLADAIGLWGATTDRVALGTGGAIGSGGSLTNYVGYTVKDGSTNTTLGPAIDTEVALWHLAEIWAHGDALHFYIDGEEFGDNLPMTDVADVPATLSMFFWRNGTGDPMAVQFDKACAIMRSPVVGETS